MVPGLMYERLPEFGVDFAVDNPNTGGYYPSGGFFVDCLAMESPYDYDPFWRACIEHKVAVTAHSSSMGWEGRASVNNFTFNHIGHWEKRHDASMRAHLDPKTTDMDVFASLLSQYGGARYDGKIADIVAGPSTLKPFMSPEELAGREYNAGPPVDDYAAADISGPDDLAAIFSERFFCGCEADDPTAAWAYK